MKTAMQAVWDSALQKFSRDGAPPFAADAKADFDVWASSPKGDSATLAEAATEAESCLSLHRAYERWYRYHSPGCSTKYRGCAPDCPKALREAGLLRANASTNASDPLPQLSSWQKWRAQQSDYDPLPQLLEAVSSWQKWRAQQSDSDEQSAEERELATSLERLWNELRKKGG